MYKLLYLYLHFIIYSMLGYLIETSTIFLLVCVAKLTGPSNKLLIILFGLIL